MAAPFLCVATVVAVAALVWEVPASPGPPNCAIRSINRMTSRPSVKVSFQPRYIGLAGLEQRTGLEPAKPAWKAGVLPITLTLRRCRSFPAVANHVMVHRRLYVSRFLSGPKHTCSKGELNDLAFGHVPMCPQLQHRGLRGLLQDLASPKRLPAKTLFTRGVHVELVQTTGFEPVTSLREGRSFRAELHLQIPTLFMSWWAS